MSKIKNILSSTCIFQAVVFNNKYFNQNFPNLKHASVLNIPNLQFVRCLNAAKWFNRLKSSLSKQEKENVSDALQN